jgi:parallel beta-helix repeat protein
MIRRRTPLGAFLVTAALVPTALVPVAGRPAGAAGLPVVDCARADERIVLTASAQLDPSCVWTGGVDLAASNVTLDCAGATIQSAPGAGGRGITVVTPVDVPQTDVTIRNCTVRGFLNSIRITRDGFRSLPAGSEYEATGARILVEDNDLGGSRGVGIFVDGYVSDVTIRNNHVEGAGSSGVYLEAGSRGNTVADNDIIGNGATENGAGGQTIELGGTKLWYWGTGREGLSIDGSRDNVVTGNRFEGNAAGGVFLYENCGEYAGGSSWFERRYGADDNRIEGNTFVGGRNGVWVGSRMGENVVAMECSDPPYVKDGLTEITLDHAARNHIVGNRFEDVVYGVRVEDDDTVVEDNSFTGTAPDRHAIVVGTPYRTEALDRPVRGTVLRGNTSTIAGNTDPYRWVSGEAATTVEANTALGRTVGLCEGRTLPRQPFVMVVAVAAANPDGSKPTTPDLTVPTLGALAPCTRTDGGPTTSTPSASTSTSAASGPSAVTAARPAAAVRADPAYTG